MHLKATNAVSAFWACAPNTFSKNSEATVVPDSKMSDFEAALRGSRLGIVFVESAYVHVRKVCNICEDVQRGRNPERERSGDLEGTHWILDVIHDVVHVLPSCI